MILNILKEALCEKTLLVKVIYEIISIFEADLFRENWPSQYIHPASLLK